MDSSVNPQVSEHQGKYKGVSKKSPDVHVNCCSPKNDDHQNVSPKTMAAANAAKAGGASVPLPGQGDMKLHCPD
jgi:hypothetical protein